MFGYRIFVFHSILE